MTPEDRIELLIKPLVAEWREAAKDDNASITKRKPEYKSALLDAAKQLENMLNWQPLKMRK